MCSIPEPCKIKRKKGDDIPAWFRGTSSFQIIAADNLQNALRDDCEQNTTHRVTACLQKIGLSPLCGARMLMSIMRLSRGNDLALLYGLLALYYNTPATTTYTINQQLIMSTICHLDMITTLRELDRILPPGHPSKAARMKQRRADRAHEVAFAKEQRKARAKKQPAKPIYFQKLVRPRCNNNPIKNDQPSVPTTIQPYEAYKDPHYTVPNEDRWFVNYQLNPSKRIAKKIIIDEMDKIFTDFDFILDKANNTEIICEKHFQEYLAELRKEDEKRAKEKMRCRELLEMTNTMRKLRSERVKRRLYHDIDCHRHKIRKDHKDKFFRVKVISGPCQVEDKLIPVRKNEPYFKIFKDEFHPHTPLSSEVDIPGRYLKPCKCYKAECKVKEKPTAQTCFCHAAAPGAAPPPKPKVQHVCSGCHSHPPNTRLRERSCYSHPPRLNICPLDLISKLPRPFIPPPEPEPPQKPKGKGKGKGKDKGKGKGKGKRQKGGCDIDPSNEESPLQPCCKRWSRFRLLKPSKTCQKIWTEHASKHPRASITINERFNAEQNDFARNETPSKTYFTAATEHVPHKFDYNRIFRFSTHDIQNTVQRGFVKIFDRENSVPSEKDGQPNVLGAALHFFNKYFKEGVLMKKAEIEAEEEKTRLDLLSGKSSDAAVVLRKKYPQKYFDPDNKKLMDHMLFDAFELMKRSPYYVLASFPEVYKLPMLREWIYKRYGKSYTKEDRIQFLQKYANVFQRLVKQKMPINFPNLSLFRTRSNITFKERDCLLKEYEKVKQKLLDQADNFIMKTSREFWFAMQPYLSTKGPPRNTYFAYMPARLSDIQHFFLWKNDEYRDYKQYWEKRFNAKRAAERI